MHLLLLVAYPVFNVTRLTWACRREQKDLKKQREDAVRQLLRDGSVHLDNLEKGCHIQHTAPTKGKSQGRSCGEDGDPVPDAVAQAVAWEKDALSIPQSVLQAAAQHKMQKALQARGAPTFDEWLHHKMGHVNVRGHHRRRSIGKTQRKVSSPASCCLPGSMLATRREMTDTPQSC
jgi:hypothetical protein